MHIAKFLLKLGKLAWLISIASVFYGSQAWGQGKSFKDDMAERTRACTACHGEQGRAGPDGYYPRLAGKPAGYLFNRSKSVV